MSLIAERKQETEARKPTAQESVSRDELWSRGWAIYYQNRDTIETEDNIGKFITIEVFTGDYEIGSDNLKILGELRSRHLDPANVTLRIGYTTTYARHPAKLERLTR